MNIQVTYKGKKNKISVPIGSKVLDALEKAKINPETVLVKRRGEILPDTEKLKDKDHLELLSVISGG